MCSYTRTSTGHPRNFESRLGEGLIWLRWSGSRTWGTLDCSAGSGEDRRLINNNCSWFTVDEYSTAMCMQQLLQEKKLITAESLAGDDSPGNNSRGCLGPPRKWQGLAGAPSENFRPFQYLCMFAGADPVSRDRWVRGDRVVFWSPVASLSHPGSSSTGDLAVNHRSRLIP